MKELLNLIITNLVGNPEDVQITEMEGENSSIYEVRVHREDLGKVIGKQGRTAKSIRTILNAAASRQGKRALMEIIDQE